MNKANFSNLLTDRLFMNYLATLIILFSLSSCAKEEIPQIEIEASSHLS